MDRTLAINLVRVTESAALGAAKYMGRGDKNLADQAAVDNMRKMFDTLNIDGTVVIGEGEMDEAPMLYIGEHIGMKGAGFTKVDIAVDPIDGTIAVAKGLDNAIAVVAMAPSGCLLAAPDMYMNKIAVGPKGKGAISLSKSVEENIRDLAVALGKDITDITVTMLDRERHEPIIKVCRELGTRIKLFKDGDVAQAIATCFEDSGVDIMMGSGGAPEGVIAAAAIKCLGGDMQGQLLPETEEERERCANMGADFKHILTMDDLVKSDDIYFAATGITDGDLIDGVRYIGDNKAVTHSIVIRGTTGTVREIKATHTLPKKPDYAF